MCLYPKLIKNRKYTANKKNRGVPPPVTDERTKYVPIGCQNCMECRKQKARGWQARLLEDIKTNKNGKFITLTFSNESIQKISKEIYKEHPQIKGYELDNAIATMAMRRFNERWRKKYTKAIRHWTVTELGHLGTNNIHIHGIIWTNENLNTVQKIWQYGWIWKGTMENGTLKNYVNESTVNYIVKYIHKMDEIHTQYKSKVLTSPGIGATYTNTYDSKKNKFNETDTIETYRTRTGHKVAMPIYWRNKIYSEQEREKLWLQRLDKNERWVCGEKVNISENMNEYYKLQKYHQDRNIKLGYGTDEISWEKKKYEEEIREMMQAKRTEQYKTPSAGSNSKGNGLIAYAIARTNDAITQNLDTVNKVIQIHQSKWMVTEQGIRLLT